jgi:hypothetical protein
MVLRHATAVTRDLEGARGRAHSEQAMTTMLCEVPTPSRERITSGVSAIVTTVPHAAGVVLLPDDAVCRDLTMELNRVGLATVVPGRRVPTAALIDWVKGYEPLGGAPIGIFGSPAVLDGAAQRPHDVHSVVVCGGRPGWIASLEHVRAATLLVTGGRDFEGIASCEAALARLHCLRRLEVIPGALTACSDSRGRLAILASRWLLNHAALPVEKEVFA